MSLFAVALACLGHLVLMIGSHNWVYGQPLGKKAGDVMHLFHTVVVLALPAALLAVWGWTLQGVFDLAGAPWWHVAVVCYLTVCVAVLFVWLPYVTIRRLVRREPGAVTRSEVVDVVAVLGRRPVGDGHHAFLAKVPGTQIFQIELVERTIPLPRLSAAWDGLTILHLSDVHFHGTPDFDYYRVLMERCAAWKPDLVAITGDIADSPTHHEWIGPLFGLLKWEIAGIAILGNHDHRHDVDVIRRELRAVGLVVPANEWLELDIRGEKMVVIGHEGPWLRPGPRMEACPAGAFRLCLSHTPDNMAWARRQGIDLMLSGHVHGGQIRLPIFGSVLVPSACGRRYDGGLYEEGSTVLHVSRGISGEHPVRLNCRPEVTLLTLRRAASPVA